MIGEYENVKSRYPDRIPVKIITRDFEITKKKFLIHQDECFSSLFYAVRKFVKLDMRDSILFLVENQIVTPSENIGDFHRRVCLPKEDKFLYILLTKQQTFG